MGDLVNLRLERKRKTRAQAESDAAVNRAASGRSKAEKAAERQRREHEERKLDAHLLRSRDDGK